MTDDRLQHAQSQLAAAQKQLQLLTDAISHDLRAPLRAIENFATRLAGSAGDKLDTGEHDQLARIHAAAVRMTALLDRLSELSRATHAELTPAPIDVSLLAEWAFAELQEADPQRAAQLQLQPGLHARGDERLLRTLLTELLRNAWAFAEPTQPVQIDIRGEADGARLRLRIADRGIGFDPRYARKLFEPLQRLHGAEQGAGHGMGLAIAQRIAQRHGGDITAESQPGQGAVFTVDLPAHEDVRDAQ